MLVPNRFQKLNVKQLLPYFILFQISAVTLEEVSSTFFLFFYQPIITELFVIMSITVITINQADSCRDDWQLLLCDTY